MDKKLIYIGLAVGGSLLLIMLLKKKNGNISPSDNKFTGRTNKDAPVFYFNEGGFVQSGQSLNKGDQVSIFGEFDGYYKIDCDGVYIHAEDCEKDQEFRNFTGKQDVDFKDLNHF